MPEVEFVRVLDLCPPREEVMEAAPKVQFVKHCLGGKGDSEENRLEEEDALVSALEDIDCVFSTVTPNVQYATEAAFYATNDRGSRRLVNAALRAGITRLVNLSSIAVTSHFHESDNETEASPLVPEEELQSPYDITKRR